MVSIYKNKDETQTTAATTAATILLLYLYLFEELILICLCMKIKRDSKIVRKSIVQTQYFVVIFTSVPNVFTWESFFSLVLQKLKYQQDEEWQQQNITNLNCFSIVVCLNNLIKFDCLLRKLLGFLSLLWL